MDGNPQSRKTLANLVDLHFVRVLTEILECRTGFSTKNTRFNLAAVTQNLHAPSNSEKEGQNNRIERLELRTDQLNEFALKLLRIVRQQQLQIRHDRSLLRAALIDRASSVSPELLISQIDALLPEASAGLLAQLAALEGWQDD